MACQGLCTTKGLTVLPVRYAVVPENINAGLPGWAEDPLVTGITLANNEKYTLRALRQGYLYVFYEKGKQGVNYWQCYSVAPDGSLWLQQVASNPAPVDKALCETGEHIAQNVEFMSIESPDKCGNVWFAFSQYPWEQETLDRYRTMPKARSERMQKVMPSVSGARRTKAGTDVTDASLSQVLDYQVPSVSGLLPGPDDVKVVNVSRASSLWDPTVDDPWRVNNDVLKLQSSLYPWARNRSGMAAATVSAMETRSEGMTPLLLPLWDPVGIVHELNGWSQDVLGRQAQFLQERELEFTTKTNLDAVRTLLESNAQALEDAMRRRRTDSPMLADDYLDTRLQALEKRYQDRPDVLAQIRADDRLVRNWHAQNVTASYPEGVLMSPPEPLSSLMASGLAMVSQGTSVILPAIEKGLEARELTVSWLKGVGAAAGGVASLFSLYADWTLTKDEFQNNRFCLMSVLGLKTFVDGLAVTKSLGLLLEVVDRPLAVKASEKISLFLSLEFLGIRVLAVLLTWEAMVAITLLQVIVTWISDDELQVWCQKCVFGAEPFNRSVADQNKALEGAIKDIV